MKTMTRAALAVATMLGCVNASAAADLTIAVGKGLTGPLAFVGVPQVNAIRMAVDEINASGTFGADKIKLVVNDDGNDRGQMLTLVNRATNIDDALLFLGTASSALAMGIAPALNDIKISYFATALTIEPLKASNYYFKINTSPEASVLPVAEYAVNKLTFERPAIIHVRDNDGHVNNARTFRDYLGKHGKTLMADETVLSTNTDFAALATKIATSKADLVWVGANDELGANIVMQLKNAGVPGDIKIMSTGALGENYLRVGGKFVDGTYISTDYYIGSTVPGNKEFVENYRKRYNSAPDNWAAVGYAEAYVAAAAIKASMPNPTREKVRDAITKLRDVPVVLGSGKWNLDAQRVPQYGLQVMISRDGKYVPAP